MAKKVAKKSTKKSRPVMLDVTPVTPALTEPPAYTPTSSPRLNSRLLSYGLVIIAIALLVYKFGPYFVPALVNNKPITRFALWSRLEKTYGTPTLDDLVNEAILDKAIKDAGIKVEQSKIDDQLKTLESQFESLGGLDAALKERGLSRPDLVKQIKTQLAVEELLSDKITPSEAEVKQEFDNNQKTLYKDQKFEDVKESIITQLKEAKLRDEFLTWFGEIKKSIKVKNFGL